MTIGIIGAGSIVAAFARKLAQAEIPAILSNSRGPDRLADLVANIGRAVRAGTRNEAAAQDLIDSALIWKRKLAKPALGKLEGRRYDRVVGAASTS
jgi:8-hydroxy-5-deazaflavin:NADPH oxidoreductase